MFYNLGQLYNDSLMVYMYFTYPELSVIESDWDLGYALGKMVNAAFYNTIEEIEDFGAGADVTDTDYDD